MGTARTDDSVVVYVLSRMQGKEVDEELSNLVNEFFDPQDPESH